MRKFGAALLVSVFVFSNQGNAREPKLSALLLQARYVALGFETAGGFLGEWETHAFVSANILPEDRQALANLSGALRKWNRYAITIDPRQAELQPTGEFTLRPGPLIQPEEHAECQVSELVRLLVLKQVLPATTWLFMQRMKGRKDQGSGAKLKMTVSAARIHHSLRISRAM